MIDRNNVEDVYSLSPLQEGILFHHILEEHSTAYFVQTSVTLNGEVNVELLEQTFNKVIERYDILRTVFTYKKTKKPRQVVLKQGKIHVSFMDISHLGEAESIDFTSRFREKDAQKGFDLAKEIPMRVSLLKTGPSRFILVWSFHHIVMDGWCLGIIFKDVLAIYRALREGEPMHLKPVTPYKEYIRWLEKQDRENGLNYWKDYLLGKEQETVLPRIGPDAAAPGGESYDPCEYRFVLDEEWTAGLNRIAMENRVTVNSVFQALWGVLLRVYNNTDDVVFGAVVSNRPPEVEGVEEMVGLFINTVPVRLCAAETTPFTDLVRRVQENAARSKAYEYLSLAEIQAHSPLNRRLIHHILAFENYPLEQGFIEQATAGGVGFSIESADAVDRTHYDFTLVVGPGRQWTIRFSYNGAIYEEPFIRGLEGHLRQSVRRVVGNPQIPVGEIDILTEDEKNRLLYEFNDTAAEYPENKTIHELFEEQAGRSGDRIAVISTVEGTAGTVSITYNELNKQASGLARLLIKKGVTTGDVVGLLVERSLEMAVGVLGILKAGGAYLPMDPGYPEERKQYMMADSGAGVLVTTGTFENLELKPAGTLMGVEASDLAYVIYTSGSTGRPKGVMVEHGNVVRLVKNTGYIDFKEAGRILQTGVLSFDASTFEIWGALLNGLSLCLVSNDFILDPVKLKETVRGYGIGTMWLTSPLFNRLSGEDIEIFDGLKNLLVGGDVLSPVHIGRVRRRFPRLKIINGYGPTENTTFSTTFAVERDYEEAIPIGTPIANSTAIIVGRSGRLVPVGVPGELIVGGRGIARGYLNNPELTAKRFSRGAAPSNFFTPYPLPPILTPFYRTGDLARWLPNGSIEFLDRIDSQVKIRGFRIETGEIEYRLLKHPGVNGAVVTARTDSGGNKYLCAYIVPGGDMPAASELREYLSRSLPDYMLPSFFVPMGTIPLTPNGKVDVSALPEPGSGGTRTHVPPRNEIESVLTDLWQEVLGIKEVGITDNFFEIGGDSIKAIQVSARLKKHRLELKISDLFTHPAIGELAGCLTRVTANSCTVSQEAVEGEVPLTPVQHWFFKSNFTHSHHFNQAVMLYCENGFDETIVKNVFTGIIRHHDALRMVYRVEGDVVVQENRGMDGRLFDLGVFHLEDKEIEREAGRIQADIDLAAGPLVKLGLFKTSGGDHLLIVIHHLVVDGVSWRILLEDFNTGYKQAERGEPVLFPPKTTSFKEWARALTDYAPEPGERDYWKSVEETETEPLPVDRRIDPAERKNKYLESVPLNLDAAETETLLRNVNRAYNTEINDILLTALGLAVNRWSGNRKVSINLEGHGREPLIPGMDITRTVGWFTSQYPVILDMSRAGDLSYSVKSVKETLRRIPNRGTGYGILKYLPHGEKINFNYLGEFGQDSDGGFIKMSGKNPGKITSPESEHHFTLSISGMVKDGKLDMLFSYNRNEYDKPTVQRLVDAFDLSLLDILGHCGGKETKELTPHDLGYNKISIDDLSRITGFIKEQIGENLEIEDLYPLSPMQGGMFFHSLKSENSTAYFEQSAFTLEGTVEPTLLEESFNRLIARYHIFRTVFIYEFLDEPLQVVIKKRGARVRYEDISHLTGEEITTYLDEYKRKERVQGFDLSKDLLMKISLFKTGGQSYSLLWNFHHILMDGWCLGIVYKELIDIYSSLKEGGPVELSAVTPYRNYIHWLGRRDKAEGLRYWEKYLDGFDQTTGLPRVRTAVGADSYKQEQYLLTLDEALSSRAAKIAGENRVTVNTVFQTVWGILLQQYNNCDDVVFGAVVSGRPPEVEGIETIIGLFINTVPVRIRAAGDREFSRLLTEVHENALSSRPHEYLSLAEIQSGSIDHILVFENYPVGEEMKKAGKTRTLGFEIKDIEMLEQTDYDFDISVIPGKCVRINFSYNAFVYDREFIENTARHLERMMRQVTEDPAIAVREIELLSEEEKERLLHAFNDTRVEYPENMTMQALIETQAAKTPGSIAVIGPLPGSHTTYGRLNEKANQLARSLREKGVTPDTIVGIMAGHSLEMMIGLLGIWKAGGAYLPIDTGSPAERVRYMLRDSGAKLLLSQEDAADIPGDWCEIVNLRDTGLYKGRENNLENINTSTDLAYVIYTSGSTGKSKGVLIEHRSITDYMFCFIDRFKIDASDVVLQQFSISFDASMEELYSPLITGGKIVVVPVETVLEIDSLTREIERENITVISVSPLLLNEINKTDVERMRSVRVVLVGGETLRSEYIDNIVNSMEIHNAYGPTEVTVTATFYRASGKDEGNVPIGNPMTNHSVYIVGKNDNLLPVGVPGELWIGGTGLARGYLNRDELTREKFIDNPFIPGERVYKSGDLARWLPPPAAAEQGPHIIEFLGRVDHQVKIRGYRIEPGEIEALLKTREDIKEAVVLAVENKRGEKALCAYIVPFPTEIPAGPSTMFDELTEFLSKELPDYMIPSYFVQMETIPLTSGGKVNRGALPKPGVEAMSAGCVPPGNEIETTLVEIWREVLDLGEIGIRDNFFRIGGDSIKAIQVSSRLKKHKLELKVKDLFENPTIETLAGCIRQTDHTADQHTVEGEVELTPIQRWFFRTDFTDMHHFNQSVMVFSEEGFDETILEEVFTKITEHHDALRMSYRVEGGNVVQRNRGTGRKTFDLDVFDLRDKNGIEGEIEKEAGRIQRKIDLEKGPLVSLGLFKTPGGDHLLIVVHHLVVDGISWRILLEDFSSAYLLLRGGEKITFPEKTDSFKYWAARLNEYSRGKEILNEAAYWKTVGSIELEPLPVDRQIGKAERKTRYMDTLRLELDKEETRLLLTDIHRPYNTNINDILLTALGLAVHRWSGLHAVAVNLEGHGREPLFNDVDTTRTVGWFTSLFPVILDMNETRDLSLCIKTVKENLRRIPNNGIGYGVLRYLTPPHLSGDLPFGPEPRITFNYLGQWGTGTGLPHFPLSPLKSGDAVSPELESTQSLDINGLVMDDVLRFSFNFNTREYERGTVQDLVDRFNAGLIDIIRHCTGKEDEELTPSDLGDEELSLEELEEIREMINS